MTKKITHWTTERASREVGQGRAELALRPSGFADVLVRRNRILHVVGWLSASQVVGVRLDNPSMGILR